MIKIRGETVVTAQYVICILIAVFTLANRPALTSMMFYLSFILLLYMVLVCGLKKGKLFNVLILILSFSFLSVMVGWIAFNNSKGITYVNEYLIFSSTIIYLYLMSNIQISIHAMHRIIGLGVIFASLYPTAYYILGIRTENIYLTMNYSNSNLLGLWILQAIAYSIVGIFAFQNKFLKLFCILLCIFDFTLLLKTGTRSAIISLGFAAIFCLWRILKKKRYPRWVLFVIDVFPVLFLIIYMKTYDSWKNTTFLDLFISEGKNLDSRVAMWTSFVENLRGFWLTGNYYELAGNAHNSLLTVLCSYGVVVLVLTIYYIYLILKKVNNCCNSNGQVVCLAGFFCALFMGIGEGALFSGGVGLYILACTFLGMAENEINTNERRYIKYEG